MCFSSVIGDCQRPTNEKVKYHQFFLKTPYKKGQNNQVENFTNSGISLRGKT